MAHLPGKVSLHINLHPNSAQYGEGEKNHRIPEVYPWALNHGLTPKILKPIIWGKGFFSL